ncbi:hypothetical protein EII34_14435 [Arachnia propionica]|uniref:Uncharacterized protein n=1 Tax=Arachnia propionica TaxID=1750 RepID=A0A3P1T277_9ACTN|nr:hypothetical protein [Arachnia propionica]RRD03385.1 hypothetical protein EII34_14435 [Arachnia propionica]
MDHHLLQRVVAHYAVDNDVSYSAEPQSFTPAPSLPADDWGELGEYYRHIRQGKWFCRVGDPVFVTFHPVTDCEALADGWEQPECVPFATLVDDSTLFVHIPSGRVLCCRPGDGEEYWVAPSLTAFLGAVADIVELESEPGDHPDVNEEGYPHSERFVSRVEAILARHMPDAGHRETFRGVLHLITAAEEAWGGVHGS